MIKRSELLIVIYLILMAFLMACAKPHNTATSLNAQAAETGLSDNPAPSTHLFKTSDYVLGPEDVLDVLVWKNQDLSRSVTVRPDGKISLPLLGDIQAAGLTTSHLRNTIEERLREYKETPEVSIIVKEVNSFAVFVLGEVVRPGRIQLRSETTLLQAITQAGGFTKFADSNNIVLLRRAEGQEIRMQVNFNNIIKGKSAEKNVLLQRGDTIVVP